MACIASSAHRQHDDDEDTGGSGVNKEDNHDNIERRVSIRTKRTRKR